MKRTLTAAIAALTLVAVLGATTGCTRVRIQDTPAGKTYTDTDTFELQGATELQTVIRQGVGELKLRASSDATGSVKSGFTYAPQSWKPEVVSSVEGTRATLRISQPSQSDVQLFSDMRNTWDIALPKGPATDLSLELGVGTSDIDLRGLDLTNLSATTGVGETTIDLSGEHTRDMSGRIEAGVGALTIRLPRNIGVKVDGRHDGVGNFSAEGFTSEGSSWVNAAYAGSGPKIVIDLVRGVGDVTLVLVD